MLNRAFFSFLLVMGFCSNTNAVEYQVFDLGVSGNTFSIARAINNSNQVVGQTQEVPNGRSNAVLWDSGVMTEIGSSFVGNNYATGINDAGKITINYLNQSDTVQGVVWDNGSIQEIDINIDTFTYDINNSGQVVGVTRVNNSGSTNRAFVWENGNVTYLTPQGAVSKAEGINDLGQIVGSIASQAILWDNGTTSGLGTLGGGSRATDINNLGQIVGISENLAGNQEAFVWENDVMQGLGTLGGTLSNAWAINEQGQVVGRSLNSSGEEAAFLWKDGSMLDLCVLTDCLLEGWDSLIQASDINDHGNIVGHGIKDGEIHAFYIQAVPVPAAVWLFGSGLLGLTGIARRRANA